LKTVLAAPLDATALRQIHERLGARIDPSPCHAHYRPNAWIPRCILGTDIPVRVVQEYELRDRR